LSDRLPRDLKPAVEVFEKFNDFDLNDIGAFPASLKIPKTVEVVGKATEVLYQSKKWNDGSHGYYHEIESYPRVRVGVTKRGTGRVTKLPQRLLSTETLTQIGERSLGLIYEDADGEKYEVNPPRSVWFWSVRGRALLLIQDKRKLLAVVWGGDLDVRPEGIVG
jgi:hypothetical protein